MDYQALAKRLVQRARKRGAEQAEVVIEVGRESSCQVRDGQLEDLTQATSKGAGLRVFCQRRQGFSFTSDFEPQSLNDFVDRTIALARAAAPAKENGLPSRGEAGRYPEVGELFDREVAELPAEWKIRAALEMEKAGKSVDPRIRTYESVGAGESVSELYLCSSEGVSGGYSGTHVYLYAMPVAGDGQQLQTGYWVDTKRFLRELDSPEEVGKEAARRALRMLGAKKVKTQRVPVVLDPLMAASFIGSIAAAASGDAVFKRSSFLAARLGQRLAPETVGLVDDGLLPRGLATAPFDGEGVATRRTPILEQGVLRSFLYDSFTARKAKTRSTGNASRSYRSLPAIGTRNLHLLPGERPPEELLRVKSGFYVTAMLGHGANIVTGDYSRGANGLWIENGELGRPVQEVTVAGNLLEMLQRIDAIGNDLTFRGSTGAPTLRFSELTVSGE